MGSCEIFLKACSIHVHVAALLKASTYYLEVIGINIHENYSTKMSGHPRKVSYKLFTVNFTSDDQLV